MKNNITKPLLGLVFFIQPGPDYLNSQNSEREIKSYSSHLPFESGNQEYKTPEEVENFFISEKALTKGVLQEFNRFYKPLLLSSSEIFKVPYAFQSCLIYKESRFDEEAVSHVGAMGVAQVTEDTFFFLLKALRIGRAAHQEPSFIALEEELIQYQVLRESRDYKTYYKVLFKQMYKMWIHYLASNDVMELDLDTKKHKKILYTPEYAIGLSGLYLYYLEKKIKYTVLKDSEITANWLDPEFYLSVAGAYNQGAKRLIRAVKNHGRKPRFSKWVNYQSRIKETRKYISSIRSCMQSDQADHVKVAKK